MATKKETKTKEVKKVVKKKAAPKKTTPAKKTAAVKKTVKKPAIKKPEVKKASVAKIEGKYFEAVGRRKTAVARVRLYIKGKNEIIVNGKSLKDYFKNDVLEGKIMDPLNKMKITDKFTVSVIVKGGGIDSQAEAIRHGVARALVEFNPIYRKRLRKEGYLTRDPRMKERKKPGLKRARKAPQWSKR